MPEPTAGPRLPAWAAKKRGILREARPLRRVLRELKLTTVCGVNLREPGVIERVIRNDETVCTKPNPIGFRKLRELVMATFSSLGKAIDRIGPEETQMIVEAIRERLDHKRELGGTSRQR